MADDRIGVLAEFRAALAQSAVPDRDAFQKAIVDALIVFGVTQADLAGWFNTSRATVNRWATGESAPYPGMRKVIVQKLGMRAAYLHRQLKEAAARSAPTPAVAVGEDGGSGAAPARLAPELAWSAQSRRPEIVGTAA